ncbi:MAG: murein biosynthesis integral membrane protein MurJ [Clostridia bacterium]
MGRLGRMAFWLLVIQLVSKGLGFIREITIANFFGASYVVDAYQMSIGIPGTIFGAILGAMATTFIPMYTKLKVKKNGSEEVYTSNLINALALLGILCSILGFYFAKEVVSVFASGFAGPVFALTVSFVKVSFFSIIITSINSIATSYLQIHGRFIISDLSTLANNFVIVSMVILAFYFEPTILIWGYVLAQAINLLIQLVVMRKIGHHHKLQLNLKGKELRETVLLALPVFVGQTAGAVNLFVDRSIASGLPEGSIAALSYGATLNGFAFGIIAAIAAKLIYPAITERAVKNDMEGFKSYLSSGLQFLLVLLIPITIGAIILGKPVTEVVFARGAFDAKATTMTYQAFVFYNLGIVGMGVNGLLVSAFYALRDTKTPLKNGLLAVVMNITLNLILVRPMAHAGLALATSITSITTAILLLVALRKKIGPLQGKRIFKTVVQSFGAAGVMGVMVYLSYYKFFAIYLTSGFMIEWIRLILSIVLGILVYFIFMWKELLILKKA